jgi:hypothetical protein
LTIIHPLDLLHELAGLLPLWDLIVVIDWLVSDRAPGSISLADVRAHAQGLPPGPDAESLRDAAGLARESVASPMETYARLLVVAAGFPEPTPNIVVSLPGKVPNTRTIDNGWEAHKVGLEFNGDYHRSVMGQWRKDERRRDDLRTIGWEIRDQTMDDIRAPLSSLLALRETLAARGAAVPSEEQIREFCAAFHANPPTLLLSR